MKAEFAKYSLLKLYTDTVPQDYYSIEVLKTLTIDRQEDDAKAHSKLQRERFNDVQLPLYVIVEPSGTDFKEVARYPSAIIDDPGDFARFLQKHQAAK